MTEQRRQRNAFRTLGQRLRNFGRAHIQQYADTGTTVSRSTVQPTWHTAANEPLAWPETTPAPQQPASPPVEPPVQRDADAEAAAPTADSGGAIQPSLVDILRAHEAGLAKPWPSQRRPAAAQAAIDAVETVSAEPPVQRDVEPGESGDAEPEPPARPPTRRRRGAIIEVTRPQTQRQTDPDADSDAPDNPVADLLSNIAAPIIQASEDAAPDLIRDVDDEDITEQIMPLSPDQLADYADSTADERREPPSADVQRAIAAAESPSTPDPAVDDDDGIETVEPFAQDSPADVSPPLQRDVTQQTTDEADPPGESAARPARPASETRSTETPAVQRDTQGDEPPAFPANVREAAEADEAVQRAIAAAESPSAPAETDLTEVPDEPARSERDAPASPPAPPDTVQRDTGGADLPPANEPPGAVTAADVTPSDEPDGLPPTDTSDSDRVQRAIAAAEEQTAPPDAPVQRPTETDWSDDESAAPASDVIAGTWGDEWAVDAPDTPAEPDTPAQTDADRVQRAIAAAEQPSAPSGDAPVQRPPDPDATDFEADWSDNEPAAPVSDVIAGTWGDEWAVDAPDTPAEPGTPAQTDADRVQRAIAAAEQPSAPSGDAPVQRPPDPDATDFAADWSDNESAAPASDAVAGTWDDEWAVDAPDTPAEPDMPAQTDADRVQRAIAAAESATAPSGDAPVQRPPDPDATDFEADWSDDDSAASARDAVDETWDDEWASDMPDTPAEPDMPAQADADRVQRAIAAAEQPSAPLDEPPTSGAPSDRTPTGPEPSAPTAVEPVTPPSSVAGRNVEALQRAVAAAESVRRQTPVDATAVQRQADADTSHVTDTPPVFPAAEPASPEAIAAAIEAAESPTPVQRRAHQPASQPAPRGDRPASSTPAGAAGEEVSVPEADSVEAEMMAMLGFEPDEPVEGMQRLRRSTAIDAAEALESGSSGDTPRQFISPPPSRNEIQRAAEISQVTSQAEAGDTGVNEENDVDEEKVNQSIDKLARDVFRRLRTRLRIERERRNQT